MKNRPDLSIMHGGVGPSALGALCGNTLHGEVNGDSENQTRTAFVRFFFFFLSFFSPSTFFHLSLPFHRALAAFPELQWAGLPGYVFTCKPVLAILLLAADPCLCDLLFHSCSGRKAETSCLAAAHMDYEYSGMHAVKGRPGLETASVQLAFYCYRIINTVCVCLFFFPHKMNVFFPASVCGN